MISETGFIEKALKLNCKQNPTKDGTPQKQSGSNIKLFSAQTKFLRVIEFYRLNSMKAVVYHCSIEVENNNGFLEWDGDLIEV